MVYFSLNENEYFVKCKTLVLSNRHRERVLALRFFLVRSVGELDSRTSTKSEFALPLHSGFDDDVSLIDDVVLESL